MRRAFVEILFCLVSDVWAQFSRTNFDVKRFEVCDNNRGLVKFHVNITKEKGAQYITYNLTTLIPWDDNLGMICLIETKVIGNTFAELFTVREKNMCKAGNKFLGEFWDDLQRAEAHPPGLCPLPVGTYLVYHVKMDFRKMSLQTFPFGTLRFTIQSVNNKNQHKESCLFIEVENLLN